MQYQISLSGGMGSSVTALAAHYYRLNHNLLFADTLIEDSDLYRFLIDTIAACELISDATYKISIDKLANTPEAETDLKERKAALADLANLLNSHCSNFVWLQDGRTPWEVYQDVRFVGNSRKAQCSTKLKNKPVKQWVETNTEQADPMVLGMDIGEQDRIERAAKRWAPRPVISLLNQYRIPKTDYGKWLDYYGIKRPRLYDYGFSHNNCGGFCCKAGKKQFANLYRAFPERYKFHEEEMERTISEIGPTARPFLREQTRGVVNYLTLKEWRQRLQEGEQAPLFGEEGCGCFVDDDD